MYKPATAINQVLFDLALKNTGLSSARPKLEIYVDFQRTLTRTKPIDNAWAKDAATYREAIKQMREACKHGLMVAFSK